MLPPARTTKRFFALLFVFILGMTTPLFDDAGRLLTGTLENPEPLVWDCLLLTRADQSLNRCGTNLEKG